MEQIAPRLIEQNHMQMQLNELEGQQARIDERTSELDRKVIAHNIDKLSKAHDKAGQQLKAARQRPEVDDSDSGGETDDAEPPSLRLSAAHISNAANAISLFHDIFRPAKE